MASPTSSETNSQGQPFSVSAPFDSDPGADVIVMSGDGLRFFVRKSIVTFVSPIFNDMFSLPQPTTASTSDTQSTCPVVYIEDSPEDLRHVLRAILPRRQAKYVASFFLPGWTIDPVTLEG